MFSARRKGKEKEKEVPEWKRQLEEASGSSSRPGKRARDEDDDELGGEEERRRVAEEFEKREAEERERRRREAQRAEEEKHKLDLPPEDDDDDDDFDPRNYGEEEEEEEEPPPPSFDQPELSREQQLLAREARERQWGFKNSTKTFFVDDELRSLEKSAGRERALDKKHIMGALKSGAAPGAGALPGAFDPRAAMEAASRSCASTSASEPVSSKLPATFGGKAPSSR